MPKIVLILKTMKEDMIMVYGIISQLDDAATKAFFRSKKVAEENVAYSTQLSVLVKMLKSGDVVYVVSVNRFCTELLTFNAPVKTDGRIDKANDLEEAENILKTITFDDANNGQRPYTDMGAMVLKYIVEKVSKMEFYNFINKHILEVSNMYDTYVSIPEKMLYRVAPTGNNGFYYKDDNYRINTDVKLGECYDEKARIMGQKAGNLSGHAGLFSTGYDMIEFSHALLTQTILTEEELHHMADNETGKKGKQIQYLGKLCYSKNPVQEDSEIYHPLGGRAIASAGWTGTQITIDPDNEIFYSLLSNRSHNRRMASAFRSMWAERI